MNYRLTRKWRGVALRQAASLAKRVFSSSAVMSGALKNVTVIGGGLMGSGIAQVAAQTGHYVTLVDMNDTLLTQARTRIQQSLQRIAKRVYKDIPSEGESFIKQTLNRLTSTLNLNESVKNADLVVEAIVENIDTKQNVFSSIDKVAPSHTIFASNTSSLRITEIASVCERKDRFGGLHFSHPVPVMKLLEVVVTADTSEDTYKKMIEWGHAMGKTTITCKDTPGFVVNRVLLPFVVEAMRLLDRGEATAQDIDTALKLGANHPMGPLEVADFLGNDIIKAVFDGWHKKWPENPLFEPIPLLDKLVAERKFGVKTGEGFYSYQT